MITEDKTKGHVYVSIKDESSEIKSICINDSCKCKLKYHKLDTNVILTIDLEMCETIDRYRIFCSDIKNTEIVSMSSNAIRTDVSHYETRYKNYITMDCHSCKDTREFTIHTSFIDGDFLILKYKCNSCGEIISNKIEIKNTKLKEDVFLSNNYKNDNHL